MLLQPVSTKDTRKILALMSIIMTTLGSDQIKLLKIMEAKLDGISLFTIIQASLSLEAPHSEDTAQNGKILKVDTRCGTTMIELDLKMLTPTTEAKPDGTNQFTAELPSSVVSTKGALWTDTARKISNSNKSKQKRLKTLMTT